MNSHEQYEIEQASRALAKRFLFAYVERGDSFESLKASHMGMGCTGESVCIGGWMNGKSYTTDFVLVAVVGGKEANVSFKLRDIIKEIQGDILSARDIDDFKLEPG